MSNVLVSIFTQRLDEPFQLRNKTNVEGVQLCHIQALEFSFQLAPPLLLFYHHVS